APDRPRSGWVGVWEPACGRLSDPTRPPASGLLRAREIPAAVGAGGLPGQGRVELGPQRRFPEPALAAGRAADGQAGEAVAGDGQDGAAGPVQARGGPEGGKAADEEAGEAGDEFPGLSRGADNGGGEA